MYLKAAYEFLAATCLILELKFESFLHFWMGKPLYKLTGFKQNCNIYVYFDLFSIKLQSVKFRDLIHVYHFDL